MAKTIKDFGIAFLFLLAIATSVSAVNIAACGALAAGTSYDLTADIINSAAADCFTTGGNNVILNCNAHIVDGIDGANTHGFNTANNGIEVYNCTFTDWKNAIVSTGTSLVIHDINSSSNGGAGAAGEAGDLWFYTTGSSTITAYNLNFSGTTPAYRFLLSKVANARLENSTIDIGSSAMMLLNQSSNISISNVVADFSRVQMLPAGHTTDINISGTNAIVIKAINETSSNRLFFNMTSTNGGIVSSFLNGYTFIANLTNFTGTPAITISNSSGYTSRQFVPSVATSGSSQFVFALPSTTATLGTKLIQVVTSNFQPIAGATVLALVSYMGTYSARSCQGTTDGSGVTSCPALDSTTQYLLNVSATGYVTSSYVVIPVASQYNVILQQTFSPGFTYPNNNVTCEFTPGVASITNVSSTFTYRVYAANNASLFDYFGWNVYNGTTLFATANTSSATGGFLTATIVPYNVTDISVYGFYKLSSNATVYNCTAIYGVYYFNTSYNYTAASLLTALKTNDGGGWGTNLITIVFLIFALAVGALVSKLSVTAGLAAYILTLGVEATIGGTAWYFVLVNVIVVVGIIVYRDGMMGRY